MYEACIPKDFWGVSTEQVQHNTDVFNESILPYTQQLRRARAKGYGLMLLGDNGVGKTMFLCYVLVQAIEQGFTAYYTSMPKFDWQVKRSFDSPEDAERLNYMLTSDFVVIDELAKERTKAGDNYMRLSLERVLKERFDNSLPTLVAANANMKTLEALYGSTLTSIFVGKYRIITMEPGDFREQLRGRMNKDMGYKP